MNPSHETEIRLLVGVDDTDTRETRGTGFHTRALCARLATLSLGAPEGITRHQLLVDRRIAYTSHNSAACLSVRAPPWALPAVASACRDFLRAESARGSDAGLCIVPFENVAADILAFGAQAKVELVERAAAERLGHHLILEGLTGDGSGVIGALAAVGLRASGDDGRFLWLPGLREPAQRRYRVAELPGAIGVDRVQAIDGTPVERGDALVDLGPWPRPILRNGQAILMVERVNDDPAASWRVASKAILKRY